VLPRANIQIPNKVNLTKNFDLNTKNQFIIPINFTGFIGFMRSTSATGSTNSIKNVNAIRFIGNIIPTILFSILEDITQQLVESKHTLILGKFFKIIPYLKKYVTTKLAPGKRIVTTLGPNLVITSLTIYFRMAVIHVQLGKNMVDDVLLDGGSCVNIMMEEL